MCLSSIWTPQTQCRMAAHLKEIKKYVTERLAVSALTFTFTDKGVDQDGAMNVNGKKEKMEFL